MPNLSAILLAAALMVHPSVQTGDRASGVEAQQKEIIVRTLERFWGNAVDRHGNPIEPVSVEERKTVPISRAAAARALEAGKISGIAEWCGLEWEPHYLALTRAARSMKMVDKQVAFLSVLHGAAQGEVARERNLQGCSASE